MKVSNLKGPLGFENYYSEIFKQRWPILKKSLLDEKKYLAVTNPLVHDLGIQWQNLCQIDPFPYYPNSYLGQNFPAPQKINDGLKNYYLLDAASVMPIVALDIQPNESILDMCAAPGGKTLMMAWKLGGTGNLCCNDLSFTRRQRLITTLKEYLDERYLQKIKITGYDASKWGLYERQAYDKILLDAPCSSERHLLASPKELATWSVKRSKGLSVRQYAMLCAALDALKIGGFLVYSTCALCPVENDGVIERILKKRSGTVEIENTDFLIGEKTLWGKHILPDVQGTGPIFYTKLKKVK